MADFLTPAMTAVPPAAQAIEERRHTEPRSRPKRKPAERKPEVAAVLPAEEPEDGQPEHALDLDA